MYAYTPSNKNLARARFIIGFRHFITIPNAYFGFKFYFRTKQGRSIALSKQRGKSGLQRVPHPVKSGGSAKVTMRRQIVLQRFRRPRATEVKVKR